MYVPTHKSYVTSRGRPRNVNAIDELFLTMNRLRLGLLEKDIAVRFHIMHQQASEIFTTWTDRLFDCLGQLNFVAEHNTMKKFLPQCFKPDYTDTFLIIDCTELFVKTPSQIVQQSATWYDYKGHNTGKALLGLFPIMLPVFV